MAYKLFKQNLFCRSQQKNTQTIKSKKFLIICKFFSQPTHDLEYEKFQNRFNNENFFLETANEKTIHFRDAGTAYIQILNERAIAKFARAKRTLCVKIKLQTHIIKNVIRNEL